MNSFFMKKDQATYIGAPIKEQTVKVTANAVLASLVTFGSA